MAAAAEEVGAGGCIHGGGGRRADPDGHDTAGIGERGIGVHEEDESGTAIADGDTTFVQAAHSFLFLLTEPHFLLRSFSAVFLRRDSHTVSQIQQKVVPRACHFLLQRQWIDSMPPK